MNIFNLSQNNLLVEAMAGGSTHWKNRDVLKWWDYETIKSNPPQDWVEAVEEDPGLNDVLKDAQHDRGKIFRDMKEVYGLSPIEASKLLKTYIGYHHAYGGYICEIGPYLSTGFKWGAGHIVSGAIDKFGYYPIRKRRSSESAISEAISKHIKNYAENFGITMEASDFGIKIKAPTGDFDPSREKQVNKTVVDEVANLDPNSPEGKSFYERAPLITKGSEIELNNKGWKKLLKGIMGEWYQETIKQKAVESGKTEEQVENEMLMDKKLLAEIYNRSYTKWEEALESGSAAAIGMSRPPKFQDTSLKHAAGQEKESKIPTTNSMLGQLKFRQEILNIMLSGITDPEKIAEQINANPERIANNKSRLYRKNRALKLRDQATRDGNHELAAQKNDEAERLEPIVISPQEVERQIGKVRQMAQSARDRGLNVADDLANMISVVEHNIESKETNKWGFDDMSTAFEMASMYFSGQSQDPKTKSSLGVPISTSFELPADFRNFTTDDLKKLRVERQKDVLKDDETKEKQPELEEATTKELEKDIGKEKEISEPIKETPSPLPPEPIHPEEEKEEDIMNLMSNTIKSLIKIAGELDAENKNNEAEEVHKVIRKYVARLK